MFPSPARCLLTPFKRGDTSGYIGDSWRCIVQYLALRTSEIVGGSISNSGLSHGASDGDSARYPPGRARCSPKNYSARPRRPRRLLVSLCFPLFPFVLVSLCFPLFDLSAWGPPLRVWGGPRRNPKDLPALPVSPPQLIPGPPEEDQYHNIQQDIK